MKPMNQIFALQQTAQELRDQIRNTVRDQIRTAQGQNGRQVTVTTPDGKTVTITNPEGLPGAPANPGEIPASTRQFIRNMDVPPRAANMGIAFLVVMAFIIAGLPIARALGRFIDRRGHQAQIPPQVSAQLTQLTQAVDSIAIEVERISEGQRFTTKLLSEQQKAAKGLPSS